MENIDYQEGINEFKEFYKKKTNKDFSSFYYYFYTKEEFNIQYRVCAKDRELILEYLFKADEIDLLNYFKLLIIRLNLKVFYFYN